MEETPLELILIEQEEDAFPDGECRKKKNGKKKKPPKKKNRLRK